MPFGAEDTGIFVQDGVLVTLADGTEFRAHFDYAEEVDNFGGQSHNGVVAKSPMITYETAAATLVKGTAITIGDAKYTVRDAPRVEDGLLSQARLKQG